MNRVIIIHLNGNAYQLEESGYDALRAYLDNAARRLEGNPDKDEIMTDIEQAIAEKFRAVLSAGKNVVMTKEVESALTEMGPVQDGNSAEATSASSDSDAKFTSDKNAASSSGQTGDEKNAGAAKRLYTIQEGAMFMGVCNGLAAYFGIDVTIVRILFVILAWFWGAGIFLYVVLGLIVPTATTSAEKTAAFGGTTATAQEFIRRAKDGYYEGMKSFHDRDARREWKRKFKRDMRGWSRNFQHEMQRNAQQWQQNWSHSWPHAPHAGMGPAFAAPLFALISLALTLVAVFAIYSLIKTGIVFGIGLPVGMPLWVGIVCLLVLWRCVIWPFKAMRWHAGYGEYCSRHGGPFGGFGDFIGGLAMMVLIVWLADHYIPQFHEALKQLPPLLHQAIDSVQNGLEKR
jgi:phage shock protein PspC (stress-responsive transcriptional regulator)